MTDHQSLAEHPKITYRRALSIIAAGTRGDVEGAAVLLDDAADDARRLGATLAAVVSLLNRAAEDVPGLAAWAAGALRHVAEHEDG